MAAPLSPHPGLPGLKNGEHWACLGLGSNIEPRKNIHMAVALLCASLNVVAVSTAWETPAVGRPAPDFINAALLVYTELSPEQLKYGNNRLIEHWLGRVRSEDPNAPRTIDIDILVYDGEVLDPEVWEQAYLTVPLAELVPGLIHPQTGQTIREAAEHLLEITDIKGCPEILAEFPCPSETMADSRPGG